MERMDNRRGAVSVELIPENQIKKSIDYAMRLRSDGVTMEKVNQAISDSLDVANEYDEELSAGASMQEINWYVDALQDAVTSIVDDEGDDNRIISIMV